jgi:hypothetical protein
VQVRAEDGQAAGEASGSQGRQRRARGGSLQGAQKVPRERLQQREAG